MVVDDQQGFINQDTYSIEQHIHFDGLVQERRNPSASAMELRLPCTNPLIRGDKALMNIITKSQPYFTM